MNQFKTVSLADQVFEKLELDIITGVYPRGEHLTELKLVEQLGVSRTPIREALRRLEQERLVADSGKGVVVLGITVDDLIDIMLIRERVEGLGLQLNSKTQIFPMKQGIIFLKWHFWLTDTGKVIRKICRKNVARQRRKMKKLAGKVMAGEMPEEYLWMSFQSWRANAQRGNARGAILNMTRLYGELKEEIFNGRNQGKPGGTAGTGGGEGRGCS